VRRPVISGQFLIEKVAIPLTKWDKHYSCQSHCPLPLGSAIGIRAVTPGRRLCMQDKLPVLAHSALRAFGFAIGTCFMVFFGALWAGLSLAVLHRLNSLTVALLLFAIAALALPAVAVMRKTAAQARATENSAARRNAKRGFLIVSATEWLAIMAVFFVLRAFHQDAIAPAIMVVVGLHFFQMGRLFKNQWHYATGSVLLLWVVSYCWKLGPQNPVGALGTGLILWLSGAASLRFSLQYAKRSSAPDAYAAAGGYR
jgi:hypothetical protein